MIPSKKRHTSLLKVIPFVFYSLLLPAISFATNAPVTTMTSQAGCVGTTVQVPVSVTNFNGIMAIQLRIDYDSTKLQFVSADINPLLPGSTCATHVDSTATNGRKIIFTWFSISSLSLANNTTIFTISFQCLAAGSWPLTFNNEAHGSSDCEYSDWNTILTNTPMTDTPTSSYYFNATVTGISSVGGTVSGGSTIYFGSPTGNMTLSGHTGTVLKWQTQYNGGGYTDIPSTAGLTVYYDPSPIYTGTWDYRAVVQYNSCASANSNPATVTVLTPVGTSKTWTGTAGTDWTSPTNWNPAGTPVSSDNVIIPAVSPLPIVFSTTAACKDLLINSGAKLTVNPAKNIRVTGVLTIQGP